MSLYLEGVRATEEEEWAFEAYQESLKSVGEIQCWYLNARRRVQELEEFCSNFEEEKREFKSAADKDKKLEEVAAFLLELCKKSHFVWSLIGDEGPPCFDDWVEEMGNYICKLKDRILVVFQTVDVL